MEALLHHVWRFRLFDAVSLKTTQGFPVEIIDPGIYNSNAGPDFFNSKIKIGDQLWAGNVEIHTSSSDWIRHKHEKDKAYNSVILHVVRAPDRNEIFDQEGRSIPQLVIEIPEAIIQNYHYLLEREVAVPCLDRIFNLPPVYLCDWQNALLIERLDQKVQHLLALLDASKGDWNEVFYITLSRNFGFSVNNDAFERLAKSLPLRYVMKHQNSIMQVEALFFGQAGLLESILDDDYFTALKKEYEFFRKKYRLNPLDSYLFKSLRIRPGNFPHIKIAQLAQFVQTQKALFSKILETEDILALERLFVTDLHDYWLEHYHFEKKSVKKKKQLGLSAIHILLINTVIPILFAYGKKNQLLQYEERAFQLLEKIKPEQNSIVTLFNRAGMSVQNAGDSQSLIQLKREYCEKKKCIFCRIGHKLLQGKSDI